MAFVIKDSGSKIGAGVQFVATAVAADTFTIDPSAFLISTNADAVQLLGAGAWTVNINGHAEGLASESIGLYLGTGAASKVTIGAEGSIRAIEESAIESDRDVTIDNKGDVIGIRLSGAGKSSVTNSGFIGSNESPAIAYAMSSSSGTVTNTGEITGEVYFGGGVGTSNKLVNSGTIDFGFDSANVIFSAGNDTVDNKATGDINGYVVLGNGTNTVTNAGDIGRVLVVSDYLSVQGGANADTVTNATTGTLVGAVDLGAGANKFTNSGYTGNSQQSGAGISYSGGEDADTIDNKKTGTLSGTVELGGGANKLTNAGTIGNSVTSETGSAVLGGSSVDTLTNSGTLFGNVDLFGGNDVFTNTGKVTGFIDLGGGNDTFKGGGLTEVVKDSDGADKYTLGAGNDVFVAFGGEGSADLADTVDAGTGIDTYYDIQNLGLRVNLDTVANQTSSGWAVTATTLTKSTATVVGNAALDTVKGFEGVSGGFSDDVIFGSSGVNGFNGGGGADELWGLGGNDSIFGGGENDYIVGGTGADKLAGESGADRFVYKALADSGTTRATRDTILDFQDGLDNIDLSGIDANTNLGLDQGFTALTLNATGTFSTGNAGTLRIFETATGYMIEGEVTGDTKADFSISVTSAAHNITWTLGDFIV